MEEGEKLQAKGIQNIFNKIIAENFPKLEKVLSIQIQEVSRTKQSLTKIEPLHRILSQQLADKTEKEY
jgi:deoxyhypusine synthase